MSIWAHVNGVITIGQYSQKEIKTIKAIMGKRITYEDLVYNTKEENVTTLPMGREGSLNYKITRTTKYFHIVIYGDLRDYEETDSIEKWFKTKLKQLEAARIYVKTFILNTYCDFDEEFKIILPCGYDGIQVTTINREIEE